MKRRNEQATQPAADEFNDDRIQQKAELRLPKIDKGKGSNVTLDKITTSSQNINEPLLPRITKGERFTMSSNSPQFPEKQLPQLDPHETMSNREQPTQIEPLPRRQTQLDEPTLRENYEEDFDGEQSGEANKTIQATERDEFVQEVEEKLRAISDNRAEGNNSSPNKPEQEAEDSDLSDFQQKVLQNREIIKKQLFKKKPSISKKLEVGQKKPPQKKRNESLYEKRVREYRDNAENRFLKQKKKEIAAREVREKLREEQSPTPKEIRDMRQRRKTPARSRTDKVQPGNAKDVTDKNMVAISSKELLRPAKEKNLDANARLFENIHSILQNPHKSRSEFLSLGKAKAMRIQPPAKQLTDLQQRLRQLDLKQNNGEQPQLPGQPPTNSSLSVEVVSVKRVGEHSLLDWRRISISPGRMVQMAESSFSGEVDRISAFINKNEESISNYIRNRELLMEIELHNKLKELDRGKQRTDNGTPTKRKLSVEPIHAGADA